MKLLKREVGTMPRTNVFCDYLDRVIPGDCCQIMPEIPNDSIDMVLTDPPYLINYHSRDGRTVDGDATGIWLMPAFAEIFRVLKRNTFCVSFYGWSKAECYLAAWRKAGLKPEAHFVWTKRYLSSSRFVQSRHEQAYLLSKGSPRCPLFPPSDVQEWCYTGNRLHPTQKPVSGLLPLVRAFSRPGDVILDPFCGSGSTLVAAKILGRRYVGIELRNDYCETAYARLMQVVAGPRKPFKR